MVSSTMESDSEISTSSELQTEFEKINLFDDSIILSGVTKTSGRYPTSELIFLVKESLSSCSGTIRRFSRRNTGFCFWRNMLLAGGPAYGVKSIRSKKKYLNINLIDLISIIPNPINRITFSKIRDI
ncbi:TPA_asm: hypothetical protein HUJ06_032082 [Nelumbo nucifera]|uniref:Ycf2 N-terminal domain-containing protein n=1 Tax=Nelumbo nucifera TaxID=4432 RepID=A0A823A141_NELNU|nr:TPA_asm: hypothetical protein HUJ06_032082 [Nelumbo nucifera]